MYKPKETAINSPYPDYECRDSYFKHYHDKGGVVLTYDDQGRIREMRNRYGDQQYFNQFEENDNGKTCDYDRDSF